MRARFPATLVVAVLAFVGGAAAQSPPATGTAFGERIEVRVVNVDVVVTDRDGNPVVGLGPEEFAVYEDGALQELTNFAFVEGPRLREGADGAWRPVTPDSSFRRRLLLLVDNNFVEKPDRDRALAALQAYLDQSFDGSYEWGVMAVGDRAELLLPFSADKLAVRAALDRIAVMPTQASRYRIDRFFLNDPLRARRAQRGAASRDAASLGEDPSEAYTTGLRFESRANLRRVLAAVERTTGALIQAFHAYGNLDGNKILVWVTGGVPMLPEYQQGGDGRAVTGGVSQIDTEMRQMQQELRDLVDRVATEANAAGFKVFPVKTGGLAPQVPQIDPTNRSSGNTFSQEAFSAPVEVDDTDSAQLSLALGTGGLYLVSNDLEEAVSRLDRATSSYYLLGFSPARPPDDAFHPVRVEVRRPGLIARARRGYVDRPESDRFALYLASPPSFPKDPGSLPVALLLDDQGRQGIVAAAELPVSEIAFLPAGEELVGRVEVFLAVHGDGGGLLALERTTQELRFPAARRSEAMERTFRYAFRVRLDARGEVTFSLSVRDLATEESGTVSQRLRL
ncbi:MAG: VWA domain-containing protein [Thermoanaerobaculia bacterium]|nr:VWA domain-containing protein [Thermoanaerobaculia bacterium]